MDRGAWWGLQSMGLPGVGHDWATNPSLHLLCTQTADVNDLALTRRSPARRESQGLSWCLGHTAPCACPPPILPQVVQKQVTREEGASVTCGWRQPICSDGLQNRRKGRRCRWTKGCWHPRQRSPPRPPPPSPRASFLTLCSSLPLERLKLLLGVCATVTPSLLRQPSASHVEGLHHRTGAGLGEMRAAQRPALTPSHWQQAY